MIDPLRRGNLSLPRTENKEHRSHENRADQQADHPVSHNACEDIAHEADTGNRKSIGELCRYILSRETGMSGHFVGRIKGAKYRFDLQYLTWDFS